MDTDNQCVYVKQETSTSEVCARNPFPRGNAESQMIKVEHVDNAEQHTDKHRVNNYEGCKVKPENIDFSGSWKHVQEVNDSYICGNNFELVGLNTGIHNRDPCAYVPNSKDDVIKHVGQISTSGKNVEENKSEEMDTVDACINVKEEIFYPVDCSRYLDCGSYELKSEDEQFLEENRVHDRRAYTSKCEVNDSGDQYKPVPPFYEEKTHEKQNTEHKVAVNSTMSNLSSHNLAENQLETDVDNVHMNLKQHECHLCVYVATKRCDLQIHLDAVHLNSKRHKCHSCEYVTSHKVDLKNHVDNVHLNLKQHICHFCDFASIQKYNLKTHIDSVHLNLKKYKCHICDYAATKKTHIEKHIDSIHLNLKQHKCNLCEYAANNKSYLKNHIDSVHLKLKNHECDLCGYASSKKINLQKHIDSVHLKFKQYKCHLCEYATNHKIAIKNHVGSIHLNLKQHKCHLCNYASNRKAYLRNHINSVHLKLKNHECNLCDYAASKKINLKKHMASVHVDLTHHVDSVHPNLKP